MTVIGPLLNATPTSPVLIAAQVTDSGPLMVIMQLVLELPTASVTFTVKVPAAVGVPVTRTVRGVQRQPRRQRADNRVRVRRSPARDRHRPAVKRLRPHRPC